MIFKGLKNVVLNRSTVDFFLHNQVSIDLYNWLRDAESSEEFFYATLIRVVSDTGNLTAPGVIQDGYKNVDYQTGVCIRRTIWQVFFTVCLQLIPQADIKIGNLTRT